MVNAHTSLLGLIALDAFAPSASAVPTPAPELARRQYGWGWGWGFPFVSSFNSEFDRVSSRANFNENTLYANNINANQANDAVHSSTNTFNSFRKRQWGYGGYGGYDRWGWGFPFVSAFNNDFDRVSNHANFNENTLYANSINANQANDAVHSNTNNFISG
ncbi:hypothetical protein FBU59_002732 [Linderina macrospora]|uniref:Uncharacterized protein n=1 Tax=Linderina macrospora TaxID=4868 RepID=A0ACC1JAD1_9FUNG|nr:hypothetical protein FBU59_002732 [Linderina macrospora]